MNFKFDHIKHQKSDIYILMYSTFDPNLHLDVLHTSEIERLSTFKHIKRQREFVATRILRASIFGDRNIEYTEIGAPYIKEAGYISISHSNNMVAIAVNTLFAIGLDLEPKRANITSLYPKFLSKKEQELFDTTNATLLTSLWSAKEALYKLAGRKQILFSEELLIHSLQNNTLDCTIINPNETLTVKIDIFEYEDTIITINSQPVERTI